MNQQDIFKALVDVIDIVVEHNQAPLSLGDIKFEMLKTGKVKPSHPERNWTSADAVHVMNDLRSYLEKDYGLEGDE